MRAPRTGRAHQLRVACASLGTPLVGDLKYGAPEALPDRSIALHARRLEVEHPTLNEQVVLETAPPTTSIWAV
jgi:23S rRNA pseudouridine1911/1915/1917 synthase